MSVVDPNVRVGGVADWRSVDTLLASITDVGMTDEQRVLAVFHTVRRMFVHGPVPNVWAFDFHRVMHVAFSCYDRSVPPQLASIEQLRADPSLARDAVAENRAGRGYLLCGDAPDWFAGDRGDWYLEAGGDWPEMVLDEPFGGIVLRPGESYIRTYYRAWGVGRLEYTPRFSDSSYRAGLVTEENTTVVAGTLAAADPAQPATVTFAVGCPYVLTAGELTVQLARGDNIRAWIRVCDEHTTAPAEAGRRLPPLAHE
ncbi:MAG: hypothetical protein O2782_06390 [bacterium]|nr:hypothetical protein [bacterium]